MLKLLFVLHLLIFISCTNPQPPPQQNVMPLSTSPEQNKSEYKPLVISEEDRSCTVDNDCATVAIECSCHCGAGVNKAHAQKYRDLYPGLCASHKGKICKIICDGQVKCRDKVCVYEQN